MPEDYIGLHLHASARLLRPGGLERVRQTTGYLLVLGCRRFADDHVAVNHLDPAGHTLRERVILSLAHRVRQPHVRDDAHRNFPSRCYGAPSAAVIRCTSVDPNCSRACYRQTLGRGLNYPVATATCVP